MSPRRRHVPLRSCIVCGNKTSKKELVRIAATPEGSVQIDPTGKLPGRGAYVCGDGVCVQQGLKRGRLEYALRTKLENGTWEELVSSIDGLSGQPT